MAIDSPQAIRIRTAIRQLEHVGPYLDAVAHLVPSLDEDVDRVRDDLAALREELSRLRAER